VEGDRRELRIRADRADLDVLVDGGAACLLHEFDAHDRVLVEEATGVVPIGADAAHDRGEMDHEVGPTLGQRRGDAIAGPQIEVPAARHEDVHPADSLEPADDALAQEAATAGDHHTTVRPE
jgi:hypothetical protein